MSDSERGRKDRAKRIHAVRFALMVSVVCCLLITGAASGLRPLQEANMALDQRKNILRAAGIIDPVETPDRDTLNRLFEQKMTRVTLDENGDRVDTDDDGGLSLYLYQEGDNLKAYVIPIESRGLWGKIKGYIAFENDGRTVAGFTVYNHAETPGLGGEIEKAWFQKNFVGKQIVNDQGQFVSVAIAKGQVSALPDEKKAHYVDGISGATLTGNYLSQGLKEELQRYEPISVRLRQGRGWPETVEEDAGKTTKGDNG